MSLVRTYWNGEEATARRVVVVVGPPLRPTWWCADLFGQRRNAVEVIYGGRSFFLDDDNGDGWYKVTVGRGSPNVFHRSLPDTSTVQEVLY